MTSRTLRVLLLLAAFGAVVAGSLVVFSAERDLTDVSAAGAAFDAQARAVLDEVGNLRGAQQAYVAEGQGPPYWMTKAGEHLSRVDSGIAELARASRNDATRSSIQTANKSLEQFRALDARVRQYVERGQALMASDVIFTESLSSLTNAAGQLMAAADIERAHVSDTTETLRARQMYAVAGAVAAVLLVVLLLVPVPDADVDVLTAMRALTESAPLRTQPAATAAIKAPRNEPIVIADEQSSARVLPRPPQSVPVPAAPVAPPPPIAAAPAVDLRAASQVFSELARVLDANDISGLLSRAADVLDARGMIVWIADRPGTSLYPMFTHGYPRAVLLRLGSISSDANNATAAAWRSGEVTAVAGNADVPGALVTPIVTAEGCVGVLAAEIGGGREMNDDVRALATIFSAQLATVVTPIAEVSQSGLVDRVAT
jgi:GAF domain